MERADAASGSACRWLCLERQDLSQSVESCLLDHGHPLERAEILRAAGTSHPKDRPHEDRISETRSLRDLRGGPARSRIRFSGRAAGNFFPTTPMDFAAWIEVYLGGRWHAFDPGAPGLSLQIEELQGDFDRMQGGPKLGPAKSDQISIVWTASPYSRSREDIIFSREDHLGTGRRRSVLQSNANVGSSVRPCRLCHEIAARWRGGICRIALFPARNSLLFEDMAAKIPCSVA
jgi:hypothetical protein